MKRFLVACTLALALMANAQQKASAWSKFNFNVGLNISREASDNNFLFGLYRNGPHPNAQGGNGGGGGGGYDGYGSAGGAGAGTGYGAGNPYFNQMPAAGAMPTLPAPGQSVPAQTAPVMQQSNTQQIGYYNYYRNAGYAPSTGYYAVPSYWYGN